MRHAGEQAPMGIFHTGNGKLQTSPAHWARSRHTDPSRPLKHWSWLQWAAAPIGSRACATGDRAMGDMKAGLIAMPLLMVAGGLQGAGAAPPTVQSSAERAADIQQAEIEARARHTRALQDCARIQQQATCVRDADAKLHETLRDTAGERRRGATTPAPTAQDAQRVQRQRLFRELEQAAPRPLPRPPDR